MGCTPLLAAAEDYAHLIEEDDEEDEDEDDYESEGFGKINISNPSGSPLSKLDMKVLLFLFIYFSSEQFFFCFLKKKRHGLNLCSKD